MKSDWLTIDGAAEYAACGKRILYDEVRRGRLRAARLGGRRELRFLPAWLDAWLLATSTPVIVNEEAPGDDTAHDRIKSAAH